MTVERSPEVVLVAPTSMTNRELGEMKKRGIIHLIPSLGLVYVATQLNESGIPTQIIDVEAERLTIEETVKRIEDLRPKVVGFAGWINNVDNAAQLAGRLKQSRVPFGTFVGGPHPSAVGVETMQRYPEFDYAILGEGEITASILVGNWGNETVISKTSGIIYRRQDGSLGYVKDTAFGYTRSIDAIIRDGSLEDKTELLEIQQAGEIQTNRIDLPDLPWPAKSPRVEHLDELPYPDYSLIEKYFHSYHLSEFGPSKPGETQMTFGTARGCPFGCSFCDQEVSGHTWRGMSPDRIVETMLRLKRMGFDYLYNTDDLYLVKLGWVEKTARLILENPELRGIRWEAITRPNLVNRAANHMVDYKGATMSLLEFVHLAGCEQLHIGVESGNEELRKTALGKRLTNLEIMSAIDYLKKAGIQVKTLCMVGAPGETPEETLETLQFIKQMGDAGADWAMVAVCTPLPMTPLAQLIEHGQLKWTGDLHNWKAMTMWDAAGVFTTDIYGNQVDFTPPDILHLARGKFRLGNQVRPQDVRDGATIEQRITIVQAAVDEYRRNQPKSILTPHSVSR